MQPVYIRLLQGPRVCCLCTCWCFISQLGICVGLASRSPYHMALPPKTRNKSRSFKEGGRDKCIKKNTISRKYVQNLCVFVFVCVCVCVCVCMCVWTSPVWVYSVPILCRLHRVQGGCIQFTGTCVRQTMWNVWNGMLKEKTISGRDIMRRADNVRRRSP